MGYDGRPVIDRKPLCLVGMSGVGKSFWAKRLEARGFVRHDCDGTIAAHLRELVTPEVGEEPVHALGRWMGMPWTFGYSMREARYLALEESVTRGALVAALSSDNQVIDTTGSVIYLPDELLGELRDMTRVVYLRTPAARRGRMLERYLAEPKPLVWGDAFHASPGELPEAALPRCYGELLDVRDRRYLSLAHVTLDGGELEATDPGVDGFLARVSE
jgi:hypothetical protein